jgi:hypothetical protein
MGRAIDLPPHHSFVGDARLGTLRVGSARTRRRTCDARGASLRPKRRPGESVCDRRII